MKNRVFVTPIKTNKCLTKFPRQRKEGLHASPRTGNYPGSDHFFLSAFVGCRFLPGIKRERYWMLVRIS